MDDAELVEPWLRLPPELHRPWFRCEYPERPPDPNVQWHYAGCGKCRFLVEVLLVDPDLTKWDRDRVAALLRRIRGLGL
jgi:hypothetical protein